MNDLGNAPIDLLAVTGNAALITIKRDGRPQVSNVTYHYDEGKRLVRVSLTDGRAKTRNLRRDPRASLYVTTPDLWRYLVVEATAELSPVAREVDDPTVGELVELYRAIHGDHPDWDEYRTAMVDDQRLVLRLSLQRVYGFPPN
jgi:PPOX class probable F420-dependent enzyme